MRTLYFDCRNGIAGDMILGALVDLGVAPSPLIRAIASLDVAAELRFEAAPGGTKAVVLAREAHAHRALGDVLRVLEGGDLPRGALALATRVFCALAEAEGAAHGVPPERVTFHEVGAADSIVDVAGTAFAVHALAPAAFACSRVNLGSGTVLAAHGRLPVPAPAVALLLGPVARALDAETTGVEMTTPTGAAVLRALVPDAAFGVDEPTWRGYVARGAGVGDHDLGRPRPLRVVLGESP